MNTKQVRPGELLETKVVGEAISLGHIVLISHPGNPNRSGVDVVSYDQLDSTLHIWEAKDWHVRSVGEPDLTSFLNLWGLPTRRQISRWGREAKSRARGRGARMWKEILNQIKLVRYQNDLKDAINKGRVVFHIRGNLGTRYSKEVISEFSSQLPWAKFDVINYQNDKKIDQRDDLPL